MSETVTAPVQAPDGTDPTYFSGRYPTLLELLRAGGLAGVEYCLVAGANQRKFSAMQDEKGYTWSPVQGLPVLTIAGPRGIVDTVVLMGRGEPIRGAGDHNGIRQYFVDVDVEEATGIAANDESPVATNKPKEESASASEKGKVEKGNQ